MKFAAFHHHSHDGLAIVREDNTLIGLREDDERFPGSLKVLLSQGGTALERAAKILATGQEFDPQEIAFVPPIRTPGKIICIGLNYHEHADETGIAPSPWPTVFARFASSLVGHEEPMILPSDSDQFDYEGEFVAVVGIAGRRIPRERALEHVAGYSLFNDGSLRDAQMRTPQWTMGKNYDATGAFGPYFVTKDELPAGCAGLRLRTRLNGTIVQDASTDDLIFDVASLISSVSDVMTLEPGDIIVTGTPSGVGMARKPPVYMREGDICEVEMEGLGVLRNHIAAERAL